MSKPSTSRCGRSSITYRSLTSRLALVGVERHDPRLGLPEDGLPFAARREAGAAVARQAGGVQLGDDVLGGPTGASGAPSALRAVRSRPASRLDGRARAPGRRWSCAGRRREARSRPSRPVPARSARGKAPRPCRAAAARLPVPSRRPARCRRAPHSAECRGTSRTTRPRAPRHVGSPYGRRARRRARA